MFIPTTTTPPARAREWRIRESSLRSLAKVAEYLAGVEFPARRVPVRHEPTAVTKLRIERGHLLAAAGLQDLVGERVAFRGAA